MATFGMQWGWRPMSLIRTVRRTKRYDSDVKKHPLNHWLETLTTVRHGNTWAWVSPDYEHEELPPFCLHDLDEIRLKRALIRPSTKELRFAAQVLDNAEDYGWDADHDPALVDLKHAWLEPQIRSLQGIRLKLLPKKTLLQLRFYLSHGPGRFTEHWGFDWYSLDQHRAVMFYWNDVSYSDGTPEWTMLRPLGLVQRSQLIRSTCLLFLSRPSSEFCFLCDGPNWDGSNAEGQRLSAVDVYRMLLARYGAKGDVVLDLADDDLRTYRTPDMNWGYEELEGAFPT